MRGLAPDGLDGITLHLPITLVVFEPALQWRFDMLRPVFIDLQVGFAYCRQQVSIAQQAVKMWFMERLPITTFPYAIYYQVTGDLVKVYAVLDCRRKPAKTLGRLS